MPRGVKADLPSVTLCSGCGNFTANLGKRCTGCLNRRDHGTPQDPRWRFKRMQLLACGVIVERRGLPKIGK